jgi:hypothetical protein
MYFVIWKGPVSGVMHPMGLFLTKPDAVHYAANCGLKAFVYHWESENALFS